jgi:hypothetical protein
MSGVTWEYRFSVIEMSAWLRRSGTIVGCTSCAGVFQGISESIANVSCEIDVLAHVSQMIDQRILCWN